MCLSLEIQYPDKGEAAAAPRPQVQLEGQLSTHPQWECTQTVQVQVQCACVPGQKHRPLALRLSSSWPLLSQLHTYTHTYGCVYTYTIIQYFRSS